MARQRMIRPDIWDSPSVFKLTHSQFRLYIWLISNADDEGRLRWDADMVRLRICKNYRNDIIQDLDILKNLRLILSYQVGDVHVVAHPRWTMWQRIDEPKKSLLPPPPANSGNIPGTIPEASAQEVNRKEVNRKEVKISEDMVGFDKFWELYPATCPRKHKQPALAAWGKVKPDSALCDEIMAGLSAWVSCEQWRKDGGEFIPAPAVFINRKQWRDIPSNRAKTGSGAKWDRSAPSGVVKV